MKILQAITLSALLLLNISKVCSQEDKKTKDFFNSGGYISEGYALDRNQVRFNQSSDFVFHHIPNGNLICITSKQFRAHALVDIIIAYYQKTVILLHTYLCLPYSAGIKILFMLTLVLKQDL